MKSLLFKKINFSLLIIIFLITFKLNSQIVGDYRSVNSGNWTSLSTWQYYNGIAWVTPSGSNSQGYPSQYIGTKTVTILATNTVTFLNTYVTTAFPNLIINGTLTLNGSGGSPIFNIKANSVIVTPNLTPAATINFATKGNLTLPVNATIQTGLLGLSGSCTANQIITIGTTPLSTCAGAGQVPLLFSQFMTSGGTLNAQPTSNSFVCATNTINLNGTILGTPGIGLIYTWTITNPLGATTTINSQNTTIPNAIVGTYSAKLKVATTYGSTAFSNDETIQIVVNPNPIVTLSPSSIICSNTIKLISATGASSYSWTSSVAGTLFSDSLATIPYSGSNIATVYVKSSTNTTVTANGITNGCSNSNSTILTVKSSATWDGAFWSTNPTVDRDIIFNGSFSSIEDLVGCSCLVNSGNIVVNSTHDMILQRNVTVAGGTLTFENNANLLQTENVSNTGNIIIKRKSTALMRLDYTLWSSPVVGQNLLSFSTATLANRFYEFNTLSNVYSVTANTTDFSIGKGYLIRTPNNHPTTPTIFNGVFSGVPVNGSLTKSIIDGGSTLTRFNAIGNPYPSALKMDDFITSNIGNIEGTLWFWRKTNDDSNPVSYSTCTTVGCTLNNGHAYIDDNFISIGQGFLVQAKTGATNVNFTNSMRSGNNTNQFFRSSSLNSNRFWLELKNKDSKSFGQNLIAYLPDATLDYDNGKDGIRINDSPTAIYTKINATEITIQARPDFDETDNFPLIFKTNVAANYSISLSNFEGVFNENQPILLKDNQTNTIHNLKLAPYTFSTIVGVFENRFQILYQATSLSTTSNELIEEKVIVTKKGDEIIINSNRSNLKSVKIFDLTGRELFNSSNVATTEFVLNFGKSIQIIIVQSTTENGIVYSEKVIN